MKLPHRVALRTVCLSLLFTALAAAQQEPLTTRQFVWELNAWEARLQQVASGERSAAELRSSVPDAWRVQSGGVTIRASCDWLREGLAKMEKNPSDTKVLSDLRARLAAAHQYAETADAPLASTTAERARADDILGRREFGAVSAPSMVDRIRDRVLYWLNRLLGRAIGRAMKQPMTGDIIVWGAITIVLIVLVIWAKRRLSRAAAEDTRPLEPETPVALGWRKWADRAVAAASRNDFREAVHCAYWAAISRLEALGSWRPDPTRTPREYLRALPQDHQKRPPLAAITQKFELAWYARRPATREDFQQSATELEKLGCPLPSTAAIEKS